MFQLAEVYTAGEDISYGDIITPKRYWIFWIRFYKARCTDTDLFLAPEHCKKGEQCIGLKDLI